MSDDAGEFIRLERAGAQWPIPEDLEPPSRAFGDALVAARRRRRWAAGSRDAVPDAAMLTRALKDARLVAARIVAAFAQARPPPHREVRLEGARRRRSRSTPAGRPGRSGWRASAPSTWSKIEPARPPDRVLASVLVANRGEIARRIFRACRALGIRADRRLLRGGRRLAPRRATPTRPCLIGPAPARESYLNVDRILEAARRTGAAGDPSRLRLPLRELALRQGVRGGRARLRRARPGA